MTTREIQRATLERYTLNGFEQIEPMSMLSRAFPTNFTPSGGEEPLADMLTGKLRARNVCTIQPCFRYQDIFHQTSRVHLPYFHMAVTISVDDRTIDDMVKVHLASLEALGFDKRKLRITVFSGGDVLGQQLPLDTVARDAWLGNGIGVEQIEYLNADENFFVSHSEGYAGTKTEIFYPWNGEMVEVAVLIRLTHGLKSRNELGDPFGRSVVCTGLGMERLELLTSSYDSILECVQTLNRRLTIAMSEYRRVSLERGLIALYRDGASIWESNRARRSILRKVMKAYVRYSRTSAQGEGVLPIPLSSYSGRLAEDLHHVSLLTT